MSFYQVSEPLFSEWIIEMDHQECTTGGGVGCTSDETFPLLHEKINECEKVFFLLNNGFFYCFFEENAFYLYDTSKVTTNYIMA
jgi:hypothetical protein